MLEPLDFIAGVTLDRYPDVNPINQVLRVRNTSTEGFARRREPKKATPLCGKFQKGNIMRSDVWKVVAKQGLKQCW